MDVNLSDIHRGMAVYGNDGEYLGKVTGLRLPGRAMTGAGGLARVGAGARVTAASGAVPGGTTALIMTQRMTMGATPT